MNNIADHMFVLSRTTYGETDRILNILTKNNGKLGVIAKGVRSSKSKLASGVELFSENKVVLKSSRSDLFILTSARMEHYYGDLASDYEASSYIYEVLKILNKQIPEDSGSEFYLILKNLFENLKNKSVELTQLKIWFSLQYLKQIGALPNLLTDQKDQKLTGEKFSFDFDQQCFYPSERATYNQNHIKLIRQSAHNQAPKQIQGVPAEIEEQSEKLTSLMLKTHINL
jgi:DNA repair protein RecO (recombination protein O)